MLPLGLRICWFILSLTGLLACWITLWSFGRVVGTKWAAMVYCIGTTFAQGIFCMGIVYQMNPLMMDDPFCLAQKVFISAGRFINTGVVLAFTLATSMAVRKPKTWSDARRVLQWRKIFWLPVVVGPILATTTYLVLSFSFGTVDPADGMWCVSTEPKWVLLLGPGGICFILAIPVFYFSVQSLLRTRRINLHLRRSLPDSSTRKSTLSRTGSRCPTRRKKNSRVSLREVAMTPVNMVMTNWKKSERFRSKEDGRASSIGVGVSIKENGLRGPRQKDGGSLRGTSSLSPTPLPLALLRFSGGSLDSSPNGSAIVIRQPRIETRRSLSDYDIARESRRSATRFSLDDGELDSEANVTSGEGRVLSDGGERVAADSTAGPKFQISVVDLGDETEAGTYPGSTCPKVNAKHSNLHTINLVTNDTVSVDERQEDDDEEFELRFVSDLESNLQVVDSEDAEDDSVTKKLPIPASERKRSHSSMMYALDGWYKRPKQQPAWLAPALWRVIILQFVFVFIQVLAFLPTIIDLAGNRPPSPFSSQDLALLLAAWYPVFVFGSLSIVRRNLVPWRPIS